MQSVLDDTKERMGKALNSLDRDFVKLRTGRASASLVEDINVNYYNTPTPLTQVATISIPDSRTIAIQPWDRGAFADVEKAILQSDLGLTPVNDGKVIRINMPPLTEGRRKELVKIAKKYTEDSKIAIRNIRRDGNENLKKMLKEKELSEDEVHTGQNNIQEITDDHVRRADEALQNKESEIMTF